MNKTFSDKLNDIKIQTHIVLENYKTALINYNANPTEENKTNLYNQKVQLEIAYKNIFLLDSNIKKSINSNNESLIETNNKIDIDKKNYNTIMDKLKELKGGNLAAKPFKNDLKEEIKTKYLSLGYYVLAIIAGFVFLVKH
jgi:hypothetical protein